ncbi:B12-binding domain-containing radical SAM protein [Mesorhizobium sp. M00.F.Ca.ET.186.01.1.1]|nr:B12-binding domain-containing radical SAM protein [Mesorhizobium sp. M00.F.Ca.ET.186.01.1.1]
MRVCLFTINAKGFELPPFALWVLKAYIHQYGPENNVNADISVLSFPEEMPVETIIDRISLEKPDVIGASHYIWNDEKMMSILPVLKEAVGNSVVIAGGPQVDATDTRLISLLENGSMDALVIGEGEQPLLHALRCIAEGSEIKPVEGLVCKEGNRINPLVPQLLLKGTSIDYLPNPYRVIPELMHRSLEAGSIQYETSRGCPFSCTFCDQGHKAYRSLSMERIKDDLAFVSKFNPKHIDFLDGTFNLNPKRTIEILNYLIDLNVDWTFHAEIKPENLTDEEIRLMAKANFRTVELGLQTIHANTLKAIKRQNRWDALERTVKSLNEAGIEIVVNTIIGLPGETLTDWYETLDYCFGLGRVRILSNTLKILPNTIMATQIEDYGFIYDKENFNAITSTKTLSSLDLKMAQTINALVHLFWNEADMPVSVRLITEQVFKGKFHRLLVNICTLMLEHPQLLSTPNYKATLLNRLLIDIETDYIDLQQIKHQINKDFVNGVNSHAY